MSRHAGASERGWGGKPGLAARAAAVALVSAVLDDGQLLNAALEASDGPLKGLADDDRARAQRLALAVLRRLDRADAVLAPHLRKAPPRMVQHVLRLGVVELCQYGAAAHGVVDASVELVRRNRKTASLSGLVNAVLRKVAVDGPAVWPTLSAQRMPAWLRRPLSGVYGKAVVRQIEAVHESEPPVDLTARGDAAMLAARIERAEVLPTGSVRVPPGSRISSLPGYLSGEFWVQDAAAALPARLLGVGPGERVLDICAAPGGKTLQLAAAGAEVTALDISERRLARLRENLVRTGLAARVVVADALEWQDDPFDAVLLDAPCSATGTIRRHPDLPYVKALADVENLAELQVRLIDRAAALLRPGGRLVFCTCSLLPEEGEQQARAALERLPDLSIDPADFDHDWIDAAWRVPEGLRLRPDHWADRGGIDGFFITAFRKSDHDSDRRAP